MTKISIHFSLTREEKKMISEKAESLGLKPSAFAKMATISLTNKD